MPSYDDYNTDPVSEHTIAHNPGWDQTVSGFENNGDEEYNSGTEQLIDQPISTFPQLVLEGSPFFVNKCRGDDTVRCKNHPHIEICGVHICDGEAHCPDGADEEDCQEAKKPGFYFLILLFYYYYMFACVFLIFLNYCSFSVNPSLWRY